MNKYKLVVAPDGYPGLIYKDGNRILEHHSVWWIHHKEVIDTAKYVIHHINENKSDNRIENLQKMTVMEHNRHHKLIHNEKEYLCSNCGIRFSRERKEKSDINYCSRICSGKGSISNNSKSIISDETISTIKTLHQNGLSSYKISSQLGIARNTVMKYW